MLAVSYSWARLSAGEFWMYAGAGWKPNCPATSSLGFLKASFTCPDNELSREPFCWIEKIARENEACRRLVKMPGVGPVTATAIIATIGNGAAFRKGRDFAAWLGV